MDEQNNIENQGAEAQGKAAALSVLSQYIKDFSFENPGAPATLMLKTAPQINININVNTRRLSETDNEVSLILLGESTSDEQKQFVFELEYCGIFRLENFEPQHMHPLLLVECPRLLFPFARQIIADSTRNAGFPPLMIDPIDFAKLYRNRMQQELAKQQAENGNAGSETIN